ncbi:MAG: hypothetical protein NW218_05615 [Saprospiraceae bacterium]|nr:hypothetical protein [Saprospiraceae bacterium]
MWDSGKVWVKRMYIYERITIEIWIGLQIEHKMATYFGLEAGVTSKLNQLRLFIDHFLNATKYYL